MEYLPPTRVDELIRVGEVSVQALSSDGKWYGVTYQEDKPAVSAAIVNMTANGLYPDELWP